MIQKKYDGVNENDEKLIIDEILSKNSTQDFMNMSQIKNLQKVFFRFH